MALFAAGLHALAFAFKAPAEFLNLVTVMLGVQLWKIILPPFLGPPPLNGVASDGVFDRVGHHLGIGL